MNTSETITIISAVIASGALVTVIQGVQKYREQRSKDRIAEAVEGPQINLVGVQDLEARLNYLNRIITVLEAHNVRLEGDLDQQYAMNGKLASRVRELEDIVYRMETVLRRVCAENGLDYQKIIG